MVRGPTRRAGTGSVPRSNQRSAVLGWTPLARAHSLSFIATESTHVRPFAPTYPLTTNCSEPLDAAIPYERREALPARLPGRPDPDARIPRGPAQPGPGQS